MQELSSETLKPCSRGLLESIDGLMELADIMWMRGVNIPLGLCHIHFFLESAMQESIFNIKLPKGPVVGYCQRKNESHSGRLDHWTESFSIVYSLLLMKAFGYKPGFVSSYSAITMMFQLEDPFAAYHILMRRRKHKRPGSLLL